MELKEAIELLKEMKNNCLIKRDYIDEKAKKKAKAIDTVLQALEEYQKQMDLDYVDENFVSKDKLKEKIEERKKQLEETSKRREKAKEQEEQAVLWCIEIRLDERIKTYEELLKGE